MRHEKEEEAAAIDSEQRKGGDDVDKETNSEVAVSRSGSDVPDAGNAVSTAPPADESSAQISAAVEQLHSMGNASMVGDRELPRDVGDVGAFPRFERRSSAGGKWSAEEDDKLRNIVDAHGAKNWKEIASMLGTTRSDVQCLHRWKKVLKVLHSFRPQDSIITSTPSSFDFMNTMLSAGPAKRIVVERGR